MRAKFICESVTDYGYTKKAQLRPVFDNTIEENKQFNEATPAGYMEISISNQKAKDFLKPGKNYYLDFTEAPS